MYELVSYHWKYKWQELRVSLVYRSLNCWVNDALLEKIINTWFSSGQRLIIRGLYARTLAWKNLRTELLESSLKKLINAVITCTPVQHVKKATIYDSGS